MNTTSPSTEAREAAHKIFKEIWPYGCKDQFHDENEYRAMTVNGFSEIIQSALDSAVAASTARVKLLEDALMHLADFTENGIWLNEDGSPHSEWDFNAYGELRVARAALSIKVGETKP